MKRHELVHVDGLMQAADQPRGESLAALLRHAAVHMSDRGVVEEWDSVLSLARSEEDREALRRYRRLRTRTPGFARWSWTVNTHTQIQPDWLTASRPAAPPLTCADCGRGFHARRRTAQFCSTRCRVNAHRSTAVTRRRPE